MKKLILSLTVTVLGLISSEAYAQSYAASENLKINNSRCFASSSIGLPGQPAQQAYGTAVLFTSPVALTNPRVWVYTTSGQWYLLGTQSTTTTANAALSAFEGIAGLQSIYVSGTKSGPVPSIQTIWVEGLNTTTGRLEYGIKQGC